MDLDMRIDEKGKYFTPRVAKDTLTALIRTADGAGADGVVIPERRAAAVNPTVAKASAVPASSRA